MGQMQPGAVRARFASGIYLPVARLAHPLSATKAGCEVWLLVRMARGWRPVAMTERSCYGIQPRVVEWVPLSGHAEPVASVAFSPDGNTLASGSCGRLTNALCYLGDIRLWDVATGQQIGEPLSGLAGVASVASPRRHGVGWCRGRRRIVLWDMEADRLPGTV